MMEEFGLLLKMMYNYQAGKRLGGVSGIEKMALLTDQQEVESTVMTGRLDHPHTYLNNVIGQGDANEEEMQHNNNNKSRL
jgi:hypothetical protein